MQPKPDLATIYSAEKRAGAGKANRPEIIIFREKLDFNLINILDYLKTDTYTPSNYRKFTVHDPKTRLILALPYTDRIIHQWLVEEFIKPYFIPRFIADTYACIPKRGAHKAVETAQKYLRANRKSYVVKLDIAKFFFSIDRVILSEIMQKTFRDPSLRKLFHTIIYSDTSQSGLPIGNYTSQYFANIYLNELDQFVKRQLKIRYYVRYMDDFIMFAPNKSAAKKLYKTIEVFLADRLKLKLNPKSRYFPTRLGIDFCGYVIFPNYMKIRRRSKNKIKEIISRYETGIDNREQFIERINSWLGHALHADTHNYCNHVLRKYRDWFPRLERKYSKLMKTPDARIVKYQQKTFSVVIFIRRRQKPAPKWTSV
jgi:hypothetical protein